jgi:ABC-2 type transport system permease protein
VLRLTLAQPVSLYTWLLSRTLLRFFIIAIVLLLSLLIAILLNGIAIPSVASGLLKIYFVLLVYACFWFLVSLLINLFGKSSGQNAVALVSVWVALVLLLPSIISQTANTLYPVPSRINMIHEYRVAEAEADKEAAKMLKTYYRDHPELAPKDSTVKNQYGFWLEYFATVDVLKQAVSPVLNDYNNAIGQQQAWVDKLGVLSPAILLQSALNDQAGTAPAHYASYREQVIQFADTWKGYFLPRMFRNETMMPEDLPGLPQFGYDADRVEPVWSFNLIGLSVYLIGVGFASWWVFGMVTRKKVLLA